MTQDGVADLVIVGSAIRHRKIQLPLEVDINMEIVTHSGRGKELQRFQGLWDGYSYLWTDAELLYTWRKLLWRLILIVLIYSFRLSISKASGICRSIYVVYSTKRLGSCTSKVSYSGRRHIPVKHGHLNDWRHSTKIFKMDPENNICSYNKRRYPMPSKYAAPPRHSSKEAIKADRETTEHVRWKICQKSPELDHIELFFISFLPASGDV